MVDIMSSIKLSEASKALLGALDISQIPNIGNIQEILDMNAKLLAQLDDSISEMKVMANTIHSLEESNSQLEADNRQLISDKDKLIRFMKSLEQGLNDKDKLISTLSEKYKQLSRSFKGLRSQLDSIENISPEQKSMEDLYQSILSFIPWKREDITCKSQSSKQIEIKVKCTDAYTSLQIQRNGPNKFEAHRFRYRYNHQATAWACIYKQ